jgi:hypothetical protein
VVLRIQACGGSFSLRLLGCFPVVFRVCKIYSSSNVKRQLILPHYHGTSTKKRFFLFFLIFFKRKFRYDLVGEHANRTSRCRYLSKTDILDPCNKAINCMCKSISNESGYFSHSLYTFFSF